MNNIIIGIITHEEKINNKIYHCINKSNLNHFSKENIILITPNKDNQINTKVLNLCDGIIIPGGTDIYNYHLEIIKHCIKKNKPLLGICMGCQAIGLYSNRNNKLIPINNHYNINDKHYINIDKDTYLYKLLGKHYYVNSRHIYKLDNVTKPFKIVAKSDDNTIEAIELIDKNKFILGVQWHPEDMKDMNILYTNFVKEIERRKKKLTEN